MVVKTDYAIFLVNDPEMVRLWQEALLKIHGSHQSNPLIGGYTTRLLHDKKVLDYPEVERQLSFYLSVTNSPADAAYWFEGFLKSSGTILLLDEDLWNLINHWVTSIAEENFTELLPVLRRTFAEFTQAERRKIGEKAKGMAEGTHTKVAPDESIDYERAAKVIPVVGMLLGLKMST
jgi:hypothetical protein